MGAVGLADLESRIREGANMPSGSDAFVTPTEMDAIVNSELAEIHDMLVGRFEDYFTTSETFTISSGNTQALSAIGGGTFYKLRALDYQDGADWSDVQPFDFNQRNRRTSSFSYRGKDKRYRLVGGNLVITPDDGATGTYRLWYVPAWVDLVRTPSPTTVDWPQDWWICAVYGGIARCLAKEESDASVWLALKERQRARILAMATSRDAGRRRRIVDVNARDLDDWDD